MKKGHDSHNWLMEYFDLYKKTLFDSSIFESLALLSSEWKKTSTNNGKVIFMGNGGSAAMASHCAVDLSKNAGVRAINFNEADLITCLANDYGYENWMSSSIELYADSSDHVVLISSSGSSPNIVNAAKKAKELDLYLPSFCGFIRKNQQKQHACRL